MAKHTKIVLALFVYLIIMAVWGYSKGTVNLTETLSVVGGMLVVLTILWFLLRKKEQLRQKRNDEIENNGKLRE